MNTNTEKNGCELRGAGWKELGVAIVESAVKDYITALTSAIVCGEPTTNVGLGELNFFHSQYYEFLCDIPSEQLIKMCKEKATEDAERIIKNRKKKMAVA